MVSSGPREGNREAYSGPTPQELATLAEWIGEAELSLADPAPALVLSQVAEVAEPQPLSNDPEDYAGPTLDELETLSEWVGEAEFPRTCGLPERESRARPRGEVIPGLLNAFPIRPAETPELEIRTGRGREPSSVQRDAFLRELDEIEVALRRKVPEPSSVEH